MLDKWQQKVKGMEKSKKRNIMLGLILLCVLLGVPALLLWKSYQDVSLVLVSQTVCTEMTNKGVPVTTGTSAEEPCSIDHVDVDFISALIGSEYKADRGGFAFDINKNLVADVR